MPGAARSWTTRSWHACRLRAIDLGRQVVQSDGQPGRDVFDLRNHLSGPVELLRLGDFADEDEHRDPSEDEVPLGFGFAEATTTNPTRRILSAIDLTTWLTDLPAEDRRMLTLRAAGFTLEETPTRDGHHLDGNPRRRSLADQTSRRPHVVHDDRGLHPRGRSYEAGIRPGLPAASGFALQRSRRNVGESSRNKLGNFSSITRKT
ncbi:hypothetical protein [Sorangium sp. So ce385]|uniref:hypothetical protein n=1 Tax=Sorangium sp. So ce385 TaxID=3133308 RepID=UPI003F5C492E